MSSSEFTFVRMDELEPSANLTLLFTELSGRETIPDTGRINGLIADGMLAFYAVKRDRDIIGMTLIIPCRTAVHDKLWIEDVCVLSAYRGRGLGKELLRFAMDNAEMTFGKGTFWLTSRPARERARAMYRSLGFRERETGVFCLDRQASASRPNK